MPRILWADDEIDLLRPHVLFLEAKGYDVATVTNGSDAVERVRGGRYDVVFLDEQMPGMGGLDALQAIKTLQPETPVVMITKSEEEGVMEDALGRQIADYLIKPVNPKQILLTCKRLLDGAEIRQEAAQRDYLQDFGELAARMGGDLSWADWTELYARLVRYDLELDGAEEGVRQILLDQHKEANAAFCKFVEEDYQGWIADTRGGKKPMETERPILSHEVLSTFVVPELREKKRPVIFFLIDCLRYDQWLMIEPLLFPHYEVEKAWYGGLLPTATPFARNALFAGLLPSDIAARYPQRWKHADRDEDASLNEHEPEYLRDFLQRKHLDVRSRYEKLVSSDDGQTFASKVTDYLQQDLSAIVVNFVDILTHSRSDSSVLKEIAPDERAFRALTRTWFEHSWLYEALVALSRHDCTIVLTTDHGAVRALHASKVIGDRETSTSLRYKHGRNLKANADDAIIVRDPETFGLPRAGLNENYIFAKEDFYFVYPTNYHRYLNQYHDTFQHGGVSLEEMVLPVVTLKPRR